MPSMIIPLAAFYIAGPTRVRAIFWYAKVADQDVPPRLFQGMTNKHRFRQEINERTLLLLLLKQLHQFQISLQMS